MNKRKFGYIKDIIDDRDILLRAIYKFPDEIPDTLSYRLNMTPVKDQGNAGTCAAFAVASVKEFQEKKQRKNTPFSDCSEMWLYKKAKEIDNYDGEGTYLRCVLKQLQKNGTATEKGWPYTDDIENSGKPTWWSYGISRWAKIKKYTRIYGTNEIIGSLVELGPVVIGIPVYDNFFDGNVDIPTSTETLYGGHAVCVCGYDKNKQELEFKNSWGESYGLNGYGYISFEFIQQYLWDAWAIVDL